MSISFFEVLKNETPLSVAGAINPYSALLAKKTGIKALYISGAGVANASFGLPDLALTSLDNVLEKDTEKYGKGSIDLETGEFTPTE